MDDLDEKLIGRTITGVRRAPGGAVLVLDTDAGPRAFRAVGDCCSESWWQHGANVGALLGRVVTAATGRVETSSERTDDYGSVTTLYGYELRTAAGTAVLELRNDSNGYYGGWCEAEAGDAPEATVPVTEDF